MIDSPIISIIVPVYQVEPYLRKCVDSILAQTYTNIEVILVDDGSPDGCPAICDEYKEKDSRVEVIHQKNAGVSAARNAGLDIAKGEYIGFVDSDDWIEPDMYEVLYQLLEKHGADFSEIDSVVNFGTDNQTKNGTNIEKVFSHSEAIKSFCLENIPHASIYTKLIKRQLLNDLRFMQDMKIGEDKFFSLKLLSISSNVAYRSKICYHYFQRPTSAIHSSTVNRFNLYKETPYYNALRDALPNNKEYADYVWMEYELKKAMHLAHGGLTKSNYSIIRHQMMAHYNAKSILVARIKMKMMLLSFLIGRIPFLATVKIKEFL